MDGFYFLISLYLLTPGKKIPLLSGLTVTSFECVI